MSSQQPRGLAHLPRTVLQRVWSALDWASIGRCACVSRQINQLVREFYAAPVWRQETTDQGPDYDDLEVQVRELLQNLRFPARPDLCIVFARTHWRLQRHGDGRGATEGVHRLLKAELPACCTIVTCFASTIIGDSGKEHSNERSRPKLSVTLVHLPPGANLRASPLTDLTDNEIGRELGDLPANSQLLLLMSPGASHHTRLQSALAARLPAAATQGGMSDNRYVYASIAPGHAAPNHVSFTSDLCGGEDAAEAVALAFHGPNVEICSFSVRGLVPRRKAHRIESIRYKEKEGFRVPSAEVTAGERLPLGEGPGWRFRASKGGTQSSPYQFVNAHDIVYHEKGLHPLVAFKSQRSGHDSEFSLVKSPYSYGTGAHYEVGDVLACAHLSEEQRIADFVTALEEAKRRLQVGGKAPMPLVGCMMFASETRRRGVGDHAEAAMLGAAFPGIPISGFRAVREYGPPPQRECFAGAGRCQPLTDSAVLAFVCLKAPQS